MITDAMFRPTQVSPSPVAAAAAEGEKESVIPEMS
jgi:hypothetical protein